MNVTKKELFDMIIELRERVDALTGKPRGLITMTEARIAGERGDKVTLQLYLDLFKKDPSLIAKYVNSDISRKRVERPRAEPTNVLRKSGRGE